jgi:hypothetical protein
MEPYSFLADVLSTFRSSSDLVKIVWLLNPSLFVIAVAALLVLGGKALAAMGAPVPASARCRRRTSAGVVNPGVDPTLCPASMHPPFMLQISERQQGEQAYHHKAAAKVKRRAGVF